MNQYELIAEPRSEQGKGASRRLRRAGKVPAILYGAGKEAVAIQLNHNTLKHQLDNEAFFSHILDVSIDGRKERVVLKDMQRHPFKPEVWHVDLLRIDEKEELTMRVPLHFLNEDKCKGVKESGGMVTHQMSDIEITCLPKDLPEYIEVDVAALDVGDTIHIGELTVPEGVTIAALAHGGDEGAPVVSVQIARSTEQEEEAEALAEAEAVEAAEGAEAEEGEAPEAESEGDEER